METTLEGGLKVKAVVYFHTAPQSVNSPILNNQRCRLSYPERLILTAGLLH